MSSVYYCVKVGKVPGVYPSWEAAREHVLGFSGAVHKRFHNWESVKAYMGLGDSTSIPVYEDERPTKRQHLEEEDCAPATVTEDKQPQKEEEGDTRFQLPFEFNHQCSPLEVECGSFIGVVIRKEDAEHVHDCIDSLEKEVYEAGKYLIIYYRIMVEGGTLPPPYNNCPSIKQPMSSVFQSWVNDKFLAHDAKRWEKEIQCPHLQWGAYTFVNQHHTMRIYPYSVPQ